jgi:hypothetical protein
MSAKPKIKVQRQEPNTGTIEHQAEGRKVSFSFERAVLDDKKFAVKEQDRDKYLVELLKKLKYCCGQEIGNLISTGDNDSLRFHPIRWNKNRNLTESGFPKDIKEDLWRDSSYQVSVSTGKHGRIHGFFFGTVFNVVWLDGSHKLDPSKQ